MPLLVFFLSPDSIGDSEYRKDAESRGQWVGAPIVARRIAQDFGGVGVVVDAKFEAVAFSQQLGFVPLDVTAGQRGDRPAADVPHGLSGSAAHRSVGGICGVHAFRAPRLPNAGLLGRTLSGAKSSE